MLQATAFLNDSVLLLTNVAIASVVICMSAIFTSIGVRRQSLPLRHTVLLIGAFFLLFSPAVIFLSGQLGWGLIPFEMEQQRVDLPDREATPPRSGLTVAITPPEPSRTPTPNDNYRSSSIQPSDTITAATAPPLGEVVEYPYRPDSVAPVGPASDSTELSGDFDVAGTPPTTESPATDDDTVATDSRATVVRWSWQHSFASALIIVWAFGSFWMLLRLAQGLRVVRRLGNSVTETADSRTLRLFDRAVRDVGNSKRLAVFESSIAPAPLSLGLFRATVVLPTGLSETLTDEQLLSVLTHEVAHIARCDNQTSLVQQLAAVIFWWNPLLHSINRSANRLREQICDDYVVNSLGHGRAFAEALVKVAEWCVLGPQTSPAVTMLMGESEDLPLRVHRLADDTRATALRLSRRAAITCAGVAFCGLALLLIPILRPVSAAQVQELPSEAIADSVDPRESESRAFTTVVTDQLDDDGFHEAIVATVQSRLKVQQPDLITTELSRRAERQAATDEHKARRERLAEAVTEAKEKRDQALHSSGNHALFEQRYLMARLRLDLLDLGQDVPGLNLSHLPPVSAQRIARLREATRIRWGRPVDGLQVGFGRVSDRTTFSTGETLDFQLYVRNALDVPLNRTVKYKSPKKPSASIDCNGRITVHASTDGEMLGPTELQLQPGEIQPLEGGKCLVGTAGLAPGNYYIEAYLGVTWPKGADTPRVDRARTPGWTEIPSDLALRFALTGDPVNSMDLARSGEIRLRNIPGVSWGIPVQGLQSGVRYVRGMLAEDFNDPTNWQWNIGDDVRTEILIRNVSDRPRTISYTPNVGADVQILDASETSVTRYDDYSALMRWDIVRSEQDSSRNIERLLQPGEITVVGRSDFEVQQLPEELRRMRDFPKANRIWLQTGEKYWCRPSVTISFGAAVEARLRAGQIRLWTADKRTKIVAKATPVAPDGVGSVLLSYDSFGAASKATFVFTPLSRRGKSRAKSVSNGKSATELEYPAGNYRMTRLINVRSGRLVRNVECNQQIITVKPNEQTEVGVHRDPTHLVSAKGRIEDYAKHSIHAAFVTVFKTDDKRLNTGEPADYFDFLAEREAIFATACNAAGEFKIEPLPPGRYVASVAAFRISETANGKQSIMLPWHVGCATFQVLGHSQDAYWYPNELKLRVNWNEPTWIPHVIPNDTD